MGEVIQRVGAKKGRTKKKGTANEKSSKKKGEATVRRKSESVKREREKRGEYMVWFWGVGWPIQRFIRKKGWLR